MSKKVALVTCVSKKLKYTSPAQDLYISDWFRKASTYAQNVADEWYILSAKYGLINPNEMIEPYDETLNKATAVFRRVWASRVFDTLRPCLEAGDIVIMLAGVKYREHLISPLYEMGCEAEIPMEGLRIGEQLSWLSRQIG